MVSLQFPYSNYNPREIDLIYIQMRESEIIQWCFRHCHVFLCTERVICRTMKEMYVSILSLLLLCCFVLCCVYKAIMPETLDMIIQ